MLLVKSIRLDTRVSNWTVNLIDMFMLPSWLSYSHSQKLTVLRSLYFLPITVRTDYHFKIVLPSVKCALVLWVLAENTLWGARKDSCIYCQDYRWFRLVNSQRQGASSYELVSLNKGLCDLKLFLAHNVFTKLPWSYREFFSEYDRSYNLRRKLTFETPFPRTEHLWRTSAAIKLYWTLRNSLESHTRKT